MSKGPPPLADEIRRAAKSQKITGYRLSKLTGLDQATIQRFLQKRGGVTLETGDKLMRALGFEVIAPKAKPKE